MNSDDKCRKLNNKNLNNLYWGKLFSISKIAKIYNCNPETIRRIMIKNGVNRRELYARKYKISRIMLIKLYNKKYMSTLEIAKRYNCSQWTIWNLMKGYKIKRRSANEYHEWKEVANLIKPDLSISEDISYILGVILGDGWVYNKKHSYSVNLDSIDRVFCEEFKMALKRIGLNPCLIKKNRKVWRTTATSKLFYIWYKSLKTKDIKNIALMHPIKFVKGFYESEGCLSLYKEKKHGYRYYNITIANTQKTLMNLTMKLLNQLNFHPTIHKRNIEPPRKNIWAISIAKQKEVPIFLEIIKPCIKNAKISHNESFKKHS